MYKYYKMGTKRQLVHRRIYNFLISKGFDSNKAYEVASKITNFA